MRKLLIALLATSAFSSAALADAYPKRVSTFAELQSLKLIQMQITKSFILDETTAGSATGSSVYLFEATTSATPNGTTVIAPSDHAGTCSFGCLISNYGTGVATALGTNVGSAGAPVVNGGALGTPSSGNGSNLTNLNATNVSSGILDRARAPWSIGSGISLYANGGTQSGLLAADAAGVAAGLPCYIDVNVTLSQDTSLSCNWVAAGGIFNRGNYSLTFLGKFSNPTNTKTFATADSGALVFHSIDGLTPEMFGAKCDGVNDDALAFQAALNSINSVSGGAPSTLRIPPTARVCKIGSVLSYNVVNQGPLSIIGGGVAGTSINVVNSTGFIHITGSCGNNADLVSISGINLVRNSNASLSADYGIWLEGVAAISIDNVSFLQGTYPFTKGIKFSGSQEGKVHIPLAQSVGTTFYLEDKVCPVGTVAAAGLDLQSNSDFATTASLDLEGGAGYVWLHNSHITNGTHAVISHRVGGSAGYTWLFLDNNHFENQTGTQLEITSGDVYVKNTDFTGTHAIHVSNGATLSLEDVLVNGDMILDSGSSGKVIYSTLNASITDNSSNGFIYVNNSGSYAPTKQISTIGNMIGIGAVPGTASSPGSLSVSSAANGLSGNFASLGLLQVISVPYNAYPSICYNAKNSSGTWVRVAADTAVCSTLGTNGDVSFLVAPTGSAGSTITWTDMFDITATGLKINGLTAVSGATCSHFEKGICTAN